MEKARQVAGRNKKVLQNAANLHKEAKQFDKAKEVYRKIIRLYPRTYQSYFYLGTLTNGEERLRNFRYALMLLHNPRRNKHFVHKVEILRSLGRFEMARQVLRQGVLANGSRELYRMEIAALLEEKKYRDLVKAYGIYKKISRRIWWQTAFHHGVALYHLKEYKKALASLQYAAQKWGSPEIRYYLARCYEDMGQPNWARQILVQTAKGHRQHGRPLCELGRHYHRQKKYLLGQKCFRNALVRKDYRGHTLALLAVNYALLGQRDRAISTMKRALAAKFQDFE